MQEFEAVDFADEGFTLTPKGEFRLSRMPGATVRIVLSMRRGLLISQKLAELGQVPRTLFDSLHPRHVMLEWRLDDERQVDRCVEILADAEVIAVQTTSTPSVQL